MQTKLLQSLLMDVAHDLVVKVPKRKLLWMLDYKYDKPGAWESLIEIWTDLGFSKSTLYGFEEREQIVLCSVVGVVEPVSNWA